MLLLTNLQAVLRYKTKDQRPIQIRVKISNPNILGRAYEKLNTPSSEIRIIRDLRFKFKTGNHIVANFVNNKQEIPFSPLNQIICDISVLRMRIVSVHNIPLKN